MSEAEKLPELTFTFRIFRSELTTFIFRVSIDGIMARV